MPDIAHAELRLQIELLPFSTERGIRAIGLRLTAEECGIESNVVRSGQKPNFNMTILYLFSDDDVLLGACGANNSHLMFLMRFVWM